MKLGNRSQRSQSYRNRYKCDAVSNSPTAHKFLPLYCFPDLYDPALTGPVTSKRKPESPIRAIKGKSVCVSSDGTAATPTSWSDTSIVATVPSGATTGNVVVTVGGVASNGVLFTVGPAVYYYMAGTLGSTRVMTDSTGNVCFDAEYYPYGREKDIVNNCPQNFKFTGKERDPETGLDNFGARYYASSYTRFMSPDPGHAGASLANPESWDAYTYTLDNPETLTDPTGTFALLNLTSNPEENMFWSVWAEENGGNICCSWEQEMAAAEAASAGQRRIKAQAMGDAALFGIPARLALAVLEHENPKLNIYASHKNSNGTADYGLMMVNSVNFNGAFPGPSGRSFVVSAWAVEADWHYNLFVGMALLNVSYRFALKHAPNDVPAATYAHYNAWRYWRLYTVPGSAVYRHVQAFLRVYDSLATQ